MHFVGVQYKNMFKESVTPVIAYEQHNIYIYIYIYIQSDTKKRELLKNPTKIEEIQGKKKLLTEIEPLQLAF